jgi:hypothetical protein
VVGQIRSTGSVVTYKTVAMRVTIGVDNVMRLHEPHIDLQTQSLNYIFENNQLIIIKDNTFRTLKQNGDLSNYKIISNQSYNHYYVSNNQINDMVILGFDDANSVIDYFVFSSINHSLIDSGTITDENNVYNPELKNLYNKKSTVSKDNAVYTLGLDYLIKINLDEKSISKRSINIPLGKDQEYFNLTVFNNEVYYLTKEFNLVKIITN